MILSHILAQEHPNSNFWISNKLFHWLILKPTLEKVIYFWVPKPLDASLTTSTKETLNGILIDSELSFDQHVSSIYSKAKIYMLQDALLPLCYLKNVEP